MITVTNLTKIYKSPAKSKHVLSDIFNRKYRETVALNNVSFQVEPGELVGFIGPNGAGKTTTLKILSGILYPTSGTIDVLGFVPFEKKHSFLRQISFVIGQRNQLIWDLPASDTFRLNQKIYEVQEGDFKKTVGGLGEILNCTKLMDKPVKTLSLGERMKMELIAGLLHRPKLVFFDEPTIGLDIFSQSAIRDFIKTYQIEFKTTIMLTSHYLEDVKRLAKRLIIINKGLILYDGSLQTILEKYSPVKKIRVVLDKPVEKEVIKPIGKPQTHADTHLEFDIKKDDLPEKVKYIMKYLPVSDLTIEEEPIEEIIKTFFAKET